jgi:pyridoxal phosphate enzyme (YggS family)
MSTREAEIAANLARVEEQIQAACQASGRDRSEITLIAVTKTYPVSDVEILYQLGIRDFGENRDQEGSTKAPVLPGDTHWHFQGQIQSKKIKSIVQWASTIHSVDQLDHALKISERSPGHEIFIQVNLDQPRLVAGQMVLPEHRGGVHPLELSELITALSSQTSLAINGLMAVAPLGEQPLEAFARLHKLFQEASAQLPTITKLSAGMSGDFADAIAHGATHIRVGSSILGIRPTLT